MSAEKPRREDVGVFCPGSNYVGPCIQAVVGKCRAGGTIKGGSHSCLQCKKYMHAICGAPTNQEGEGFCSACEPRADSQEIWTQNNREERENEAGESAIAADANPWSSKYFAGREDSTSPSITPYDTAFSYLQTKKFRELRSIMRLIGCVQSQSNKNGAICMIMLRAHEIILNDKTGGTTWGTVFGKDLNTPISTEETKNRSWYIAPSIKTIAQYDPRQKRNNMGPKSKTFTLNEWARLVGLLTSHKCTRDALIQSGKDLTREQQDKGEHRDLFWETVVAMNFNEPSVIIQLDLRGVVDNNGFVKSINPNAERVQHRSGTVLKDKFFEMRKHFTSAYAKWKESGQNDTGEDIPFYKFCPSAARSSELSTEGKKITILFHALRAGTRNLDVDVLNFTCKLAPFNAGYDDMISRSEGDNAHFTRKRRSDTSDIHLELNRKRLDIQTQTMNIMKKALSSDDDGRRQRSAEELCIEKTNNLLSQLAMLERLRAETEASAGSESVSVSLFDKQIKTLQELIRKELGK